MRHIDVRKLIIACIAISLCDSASAATARWDNPWLEVRSPHFTIISALTEEQSFELARELELFRHGVELVTNIGRFDERVPTKVYVFRDRVPKIYGVAALGWFKNGMRANYAAIGGIKDGPIDQTIKHEYVHFLVRNRDQKTYPVWFEEGFAQVLQTLTVTEDKTIEYAIPTPELVGMLHHSALLPFEDLLETGNSWRLNWRQQQLFYAQSWLLTHYLMNSGDRERSWQQSGAAFLEHIERGTRPSQAFEHAFGLRVADLKPILSAYARKGFKYSRLTATEPIAVGEITTTALSRDSIAASLGQIYVESGDHEAAKHAFKSALALNPKNTMALTGLGGRLMVDGRYDVAMDYYEQAIQIDPNNAYSELDFGKYFLERATTQTDPDKKSADLVDARRHFARSYKLDNDIPETLALNGATFLLGETQPERAVESLEVAHELLPAQPEIRLLLAVAYRKVGDVRRSAGLLRPMINWDDPRIAEQALKAMEEPASTETATESQGANRSQ